MTVSPKIYSLVWMILLVGACSFLVVTNSWRIQRVEYVSALAGRAEPVDLPDASSPTGYVNAQRELIVPERNEVSFGWLLQTQQMFARKEWRVRGVDYDNAPFGREVKAASPYRWWLGFVAWIDHLSSSRPIGLSVERAALFADPVLQGFLIVVTTLFVAWRFGVLAASLLCIGLTTMYPFAAGFLPGAPAHHGLARACALGSILVLLAGISDGRRPGRWFALAGIIGGLGLWIDVPTQAPILAGIFLGVMVAACIERKTTTGTQVRNLVRAPWRIWALSGGVTVFAAYLIEYFPAHLGEWRLEFNHPLYGLAWLGGAELLVWAIGWIAGERPSGNLRTWAAVLFGFAAVAAVPLAMKTSGSQGFFTRDLLSAHLTGQPSGVVSLSTRTWLARDGVNATVLATLLPLLLLMPAGWLVLRRATNGESRRGLAIALGPVVVALGFASQQLSWWALVDGMLLVLVVAGAARRELVPPRSARWLWSAGVMIAVVPGLIQLWPGKQADAGMALTAPEAQELIERHLAHWLAKRSEEAGAVVYAPPRQTTTLCFFGGLRGVGTLVPENRAGFGVALMIAAANTLEEAQALIQSREVRYIVVPSWDSFFDDFARLYLDKRFSSRTSFLINELRRWNVPPWLRPIPYQMPEMPGFEGQSVLVFEVVENQSPAVAAGRLVEYLTEIGRLDQAVAATEQLRRFPGDVGSLAARAQVSSAREDKAGFSETVGLLVARLSNGADRFLPWDRRVSVAIVLAQGDQMALAEDQVRRCLAEINATRMRALSTGSLYRLLVLSQTFHIEIADTKLRALALDLLPSELRSRL